MDSRLEHTPLQRNPKELILETLKNVKTSKTLGMYEVFDHHVQKPYEFLWF